MTDLDVQHQTGSLVPSVDRDAILKHLNLDPGQTSTQALLLICERYGLDPLLKHMVLISGRPYVTRDGYLAVAHRSGQLDGIEILEDGEDDDHWWAKVAVHRKDMSRPFTYVGRYPKAEAKHMAKYGPEMAIKCGEVMALRRAFNVTGIGAADEQWDEHMRPVDPWHAIGWENEGEHDALVAEVIDEAKSLPEEAQAQVKAWLKENDYGKPYRREWVDAWFDKIDELTEDDEREVIDVADPTLYGPDEEPF